MEFRIADTFTDSLAKLKNEEQRAAKTTAFDLQLEHANPGLQLHRLEKARDKNFWSVRVNRNIRLIVHRTNNNFLLCYVDHHDKAYRWGERRKLETHPRTGAAQLVEIRQTVREIEVPAYVVSEVAVKKFTPFSETTDSDLLSYGVPADWIEDVRQADEDGILELAEHLPSEAAEILLNLSTGGSLPSLPIANTNIDPFDHPDAQRRFRVMNNVGELARALDYPWEKWSVFLHPEQRQTVEHNYSGPARVSGSAGTGKTIVALHRAVFLAQNYPESRILLTTFSDILANALRSKLRRLISNQPGLAERLEVDSLDDVGRRLYERNFELPHLVSRGQVEQLIAQAATSIPGHRFSLPFLVSEWEQVIDAWQIDSWSAYRDVQRLGRKTRLPEKQRELLWAIFEPIRARLLTENQLTYALLFGRLTDHFSSNRRSPYDFMVVDEAQDISVPQLKFFAMLANSQPNALFFAGDLGQRIFRQPFSWARLGVHIRGRSKTLRINYRTSHQIRRQADLLLDDELSDVDGNTELRNGTISIFNGPKPTLKVCDTEEDEMELVALWLNERIEEGIAPNEIAVFVRSENQLERAFAAIGQANLSHKQLDHHFETKTGSVTVSPMHLAKGLEFRIVVAMACDDEVIPLQERVESIVDEVDLEEVYNTERHLLYVACTRARDHLLVTGVDPVSEFVDDLQML